MASLACKVSHHRWLRFSRKSVLCTQHDLANRAIVVACTHDSCPWKSSESTLHHCYDMTLCLPSLSMSMSPVLTVHCMNFSHLLPPLRKVCQLEKDSINEKQHIRTCTASIFLFAYFGFHTSALSICPLCNHCVDL